MNNIVTQRFIKCHDKLREENRVRSSRQFALSLDYLPQSLSEILRGRRDVTIELLRRAVEKYKINPVYIFTGDGPMFMTEEDQKDIRVLTIVTNIQDEERILHVPTPAQLGYAADSDDPSFMENLPTYTLPDYKYQVGTYRSFDVAGDHMEPALQEGDKVICSFLEPTLWEKGIKDHYVYVVVTRADVLIGRLVNHLKDDKYLLLISDNKFYEERKIGTGEIREIWYLRSKISPFLPSLTKSLQSGSAEVSEIKAGIEQQLSMMQRVQEDIQKLSHQLNSNNKKNGQQNEDKG
ncbi:MAG TPA: S24 family peptidase [Saprospiraceae bacterium]|nr:S24 family peptidase [Saprospiraceae bacterium]